MKNVLKFQEENLSTMNTDPWYSAYHYSHPPLVERLQALEVPDNEERQLLTPLPRTLDMPLSSGRPLLNYSNMKNVLKFQEENLSTMNTDPWYSAYHYSHPPLVERLQALEVPDNEERQLLEII
ncbi:hypothetical protein HU200_008976 [Digitaria exilis]|uniref:Ste24 endopeptidase n=1 Tax=Digitaria exilis TaxID=1010633 RepID=A0A835FLR9_9POAL|nr:hypothetical protein HU200_008976 [Digitaria exilis]